jgi:hypothetical protein
VRDGPEYEGLEADVDWLEVWLGKLTLTGNAEVEAVEV